MLIPEGTFLTGAIRLRSRVDLHLVEGATLKFSTYPHQYPNVLTRWEDNDLFNYSPLVYAFRETDIAITGAGALDGQAGTFPNAQGVPMAWWSFTGPAGANGLTSQATGGCPHSARHCGDADRRARLRGYSAVTTPVAREAVRGGPDSKLIENVQCHNADDFDVPIRRPDSGLGDVEAEKRHR